MKNGPRVGIRIEIAIEIDVFQSVSSFAPRTLESSDPVVKKVIIK